MFWSFDLLEFSPTVLARHVMTPIFKSQSESLHLLNTIFFLQISLSVIALVGNVELALNKGLFYSMNLINSCDIDGMAAETAWPSG